MRAKSSRKENFFGVKSKLPQWLFGLFLCLTLIPSCVSANMVKNSRQGSPEVFVELHPVSGPVFFATDARFPENILKSCGGLTNLPESWK